MTEWIQRNENHLTDTSFFDDLKSRKWKKKKNVKIKKKKKKFQGKRTKQPPPHADRHADILNEEIAKLFFGFAYKKAKYQTFVHYS